jgi:hypothetical protein
MTNRAHKNGDQDPGLAPGMAYTIAPELVRSHLENYDYTADVCIGFLSYSQG